MNIFFKIILLKLICFNVYTNVFCMQTSETERKEVKIKRKSTLLKIKLIEIGAFCLPILLKIITTKSNHNTRIEKDIVLEPDPFKPEREYHWSHFDSSGRIVNI